ncbi:MAG: hypothetical protein ACH37Z_18330 [Anaerolineae bacterium]
MTAALLLAMACAAVVLWRAMQVINSLHHRSHARGQWHFLGFGLSYVTLAVSAVAGAMSLAGWPDHEAPLLGLLAASAGLIAFDRRARARLDHHAPGIAVETLHHPGDGPDDGGPPCAR